MKNFDFLLSFLFYREESLFFSNKDYDKQRHGYRAGAQKSFLILISLALNPS